MSRKIITVPKSKQAQALLDVDRAPEDQLIEWRLNEEEFYFLNSEGLLDLINKTAGVNIDSYEDEAVEGKEKIERVCSILNEEKARFTTASGIKSIDRLLALFEEARQKETGVYFYF